MTPTLITITTRENFPNEQYSVEQSTNNCNPDKESEYVVIARSETRLQSVRACAEPV